MSYENSLIRELTDETPPNPEDACPVCYKIECKCPPERDVADDALEEMESWEQGNPEGEQ